MSNIRLIARLDIKGPNLIKGIHLEGLRVIGQPENFAKQYYDQGIDEILYMDMVATLYGRSKLTEIVRSTASNVFVPLTVGGGVRGVDDVKELLRAGADKVAINTAAVKRPDLISEIAKKFGSQCMVLSIEAKRNGKNWEVYTDCGREKTGLDVIQWAKLGANAGAGEILITSIDNDGTQKGFDDELIKQVTDSINIPVIASGGFGKCSQIKSVVDSGADAVAVAGALHYQRITVANIKKEARLAGVPMREE